jgi:S-(hydroxymethyl)glutathione dehydrogenase/alcohol dehydrogenase
MYTKAAVLTEINKPLEIVSIELPELKRGQVLVKVLCTGICGSQINEISGNKFSEYIPHLLGHEAVGEVIGVGEDVSKVKDNDLVVITWIKVDGLNADAPVYKGYNAGAVTTFQEYTIVPENRLVKFFGKSKMPKKMLYSLPLFGCMIPTGAGTVFNYASGLTIRIHGVGNIGSACVLGAKYRGFKTYVTDTNKDREKYGITLGADSTDIYDKVDCAIDTTGSVKSIEQAFNSLVDNGTLILVGNPPPSDSFNVKPFDFIKGKRIIGSWGGGIQSDYDIYNLFRIIDVSKIKLKLFEFNSINKAIDSFRSGFCGKVLVKVGDI